MQYQSTTLYGETRIKAKNLKMLIKRLHFNAIWCNLVERAAELKRYAKQVQFTDEAELLTRQFWSKRARVSPLSRSQRSAVPVPGGCNGRASKRRSGALGRLQWGLGPLTATPSDPKRPTAWRYVLASAAAADRCMSIIFHNNIVACHGMHRLSIARTHARADVRPRCMLNLQWAANLSSSPAPAKCLMPPPS